MPALVLNIIPSCGKRIRLDYSGGGLLYLSKILVAKIFVSIAGYLLVEHPVAYFIDDHKRRHIVSNL